MSISKSWDWSAENRSIENRSSEKNDIWLISCEESHYLAYRWKEAGFRQLLDFGCGLGRHSIFFAKNGFRVSAFDLSVDGVQHLKEWADKEGLGIDAQIGDMLQLKYPADSFDCIFAYHVISHTDTAGIKLVINEIKRVLKCGGEFFLTLCSKDTWSYAMAGYPRLDGNTVVKTADGPEKGIPHFYADLDDVLELFSDFTLPLVKISSNGRV